MMKKITFLCILCICLIPISKESLSQDLQLLVLSEIEERIAGKMAFVALDRKLADLGYWVTNDPEISAIGRALARYSDRPHLHYSFYVIEGDIEPQALSLPGGHVFISRTLLDEVCRTEADIAFILGHEIAHSALRHYADYKLQDDQQVAYVKQMLQQHDLFESGENLESSEELHQILLPYMVKVRQIKEIEADQFGALYALRAGYEFSGGLHVLSRLRELYGEKFQLERNHFPHYAEVPSEPSVHPTLSERIEQLELFRIKAVEVTNLFPLGRDALDQGNYQEASLIFESILSLFPQSRTAHVGLGVAYHLQYWDSTPGDDFLLAYPGALEVEYMYLIERGEPGDLDALQRAIDEYQAVLSVEPGNEYAKNNFGVALAEFGQWEEAEEILRESLRLSARDFTLFNLALLLHQKYLDTQQVEIRQEAIDLMKHYLELTPHDQVAMKYLEELEALEQ